MTTPHAHPGQVSRRCHGIIPPHVLEQIAQNGSSVQRNRASRTLSLDAAQRQLRVERTLQAPPAVERAQRTPTGGKNREIYDAQQQTELPGKLVRGEGAEATGDVAVNEAYDYMGATWDFYSAVHQRNSWDNAGGVLTGTVHYDKDYDNAFWNGEQMVYGDGDGELFNRFTISVDVVGHELTHGVTQAESGLDYEGQSGALNESVSDVFGSMVKQYLASETADAADWLIGEGLFTAAVHGVALRSMKAPGTAYDDPVIGKDPQPAHMDHYVDTSEDNGGVHLNSGIPNHAFYLFAIALGGHSWDKAGQVWYATCTDDALAADVDFQGFADLTATHAQQLYGDTEHAALVQAWSEVGITVGAGESETGQDETAPSGDDVSGAGASIVVLTSSHELRVQAGVPAAGWTTVATDVQAFALVGDRIAVLDSSGRLLVQQGGPGADWVEVASEVVAFALDGVSGVPAPSSPRT